MKNLYFFCMLIGMYLYGMIGIVHAVPILNSSNGHYYEVVDLNATWDEYYNLSINSTYMGMQGHLATITSAEENQWVVNTFSGSALNYHALGGTDATSEGNWEWVTGETWSYTNWRPGEPNNHLGIEHYLEFHEYNNGLWNDVAISNLNALYGYVVEYENLSEVSLPGSSLLLLSGLISLISFRRKGILQS